MVIQDTADVYTIISKAHILPGLELVEQSGWSHNGDGSPEISMAQRMHKLDEFVDDAVKKVQRISDLVCLANSVKSGCCLLMASFHCRGRKRYLAGWTRG
jgi:hypothetical protein